VLVCNVWSPRAGEGTVSAAQLRETADMCAASDPAVHFTALSALEEGGRFGGAAFQSLLKFLASENPRELMPRPWEGPSLLEACADTVRAMLESGDLPFDVVQQSVPEDLLSILLPGKSS
jgi:hypothetical protein